MSLNDIQVGLAGRPGTDSNSRSNMFDRERMSLYDIQVGLAGRPGAKLNLFPPSLCPLIGAFS
jgi:hypothetical protein